MAQNVSVLMVRENLEAIPGFPLPEGFSLRWFQPGDEESWLKIQSLSEPYRKITSDVFYRAFGRSPVWLAQRQCFLVNAKGEAMGTASAWFDDNFDGRKFGRVHWVAVIPEYQGRGLSKPLLAAVCQRLRDLKHTNAYLLTSSGRVTAIKLYLKFGFVPYIRHAGEAAVWEQIKTAVSTLER